MQPTALLIGKKKRQTFGKCDVPFFQSPIFGLKIVQIENQHSENENEKLKKNVTILTFGKSSLYRETKTAGILNVFSSVSNEASSQIALFLLHRTQNESFCISARQMKTIESLRESY